MDKQRIRDHLHAFHAEEDLRAWFDPLMIRFTNASSVDVCFPHVLFAQWFEKQRRDMFEQEITSLLGDGVTITYKKPGHFRARTPKNSLMTRHAAARFQSGPSFASFMCNRKNEFPLSMAREIAANPKNPPYNPFVICGRGICGKTHLLRAIAGEMCNHLPRNSVFLGSVDDLAAMLAEHSRPGAFRRKLMRYQAICLDNAQDIVKYPVLQEELATLAEAFSDRKKPFVLSVDDGLPQASIDNKLKSRLEAGLMVNLKKPDLDIRLRYVSSEVAKLSLELKKDHILYLARRFHNFRSLEGIIKKIAAFAEKADKPISNADLEKIMRHADAHSGRQPTPERIVSYVAENLMVSREDITGNTRQPDIVLARQISMYACRTFLGSSFASLGEYFGGKNHATVLYACKKIENIEDSNKVVNNVLTQMRKKFLSTHE